MSCQKENVALPALAAETDTSLKLDQLVSEGKVKATLEMLSVVKERMKPGLWESMRHKSAAKILNATLMKANQKDTAPETNYALHAACVATIRDDMKDKSGEFQEDCDDTCPIMMSSQYPADRVDLAIKVLDGKVQGREPGRMMKVVKGGNGRSLLVAARTAVLRHGQPAEGQLGRRE